jgi:hypothetical protein
MIIEFTRDQSALQDALYTLALAKPVPDPEVLEEVTRLYPEFASQLTNRACELALEAFRGEPEDDSPVASPEVNNMVLKAMSRFQNRLYSVKAEEVRAKTHLEPANPFAGLNTAELRAFAGRLNANTVFTLKLRDRIIDESTMTEGFKRRVAEELTEPFELVAAHFAGRPNVSAQAHYKADQKPEALRKQRFEDAIRSSGLTEDQQRYLLSL